MFRHYGKEYQVLGAGIYKFVGMSLGTVLAEARTHLGLLIINMGNTISLKDIDELA